MRRLGFAIVGLLVFVGACGGGGGQGGAGGTAGSPPLGRGGTGGIAAGGRGGAGGAAGTGAGGDSATAGSGAGEMAGAGGSAAANAAGAGGGGAAGTGSGGTSGGVLVACPTSPPSGACAIEYLTCAYPTGTSVCSNGVWTWFACPATRPTSTTGAVPLPDPRLWMTCQYENVTCSYPRWDQYGYGGPGWGCGVCPAGRPTDGTACGNTVFECRYGIDTCACGTSGGWKCLAASCEPDRRAGMEVCVAPGHFTCQFPALDQTCVCGTASDARRCTCPAARPAQGSSCKAYTGKAGIHGSCPYGDATCSCAGSQWQCVDPVCPTAIPPTGARCSTQVSCSYGASFCACDGATWSCA